MNKFLLTKKFLLPSIISVFFLVESCKLNNIFNFKILYQMNAKICEKNKKNKQINKKN